MGNVTFVDETTAGGRIEAWELTVREERLTLRELICCRVRREVERYDATSADVFHGLVQPTGAERLLNGYRMRGRREIDADEQCRLALEAFGRNGFLVLVGERQVEDLEAEIDLAAETTISFLKLVPLVGG